MSLQPEVCFDSSAIDAIFSHLDVGSQPGAAVGVLSAGIPIYRRAFGAASLDLPMPLTPATKMRLGSVTKHITCLAFLLLVEQRSANLDEPIGTYLPQLAPDVAKVTARQLMVNTSGLRDACDISLQFGGVGPEVEARRLAVLYEQPGHAYASPNKCWAYNNGGFVLLSQIIERISGQSFGEFLDSWIFSRLGMWDTSYRPFDRDFHTNSAAAHMKGGDGRFYRDRWIDWAGAGGLVSTIDDMLRWLSNMRSPTIGSTDTWSQLVRSHTIESGFDTEYAMGVMRTRYRGLAAVSHPGGWIGANAHLIYLPEIDFAVITMVNRHDVSAVALTEQILDASIINLPAVDHVDHKVEAAIWRTRKSGRIVSTAMVDGTAKLSIDGLDIPARRDTNGLIVPAGSFAYIKRALRTSCAAKSASFIDFGEEEELETLPPVQTNEHRHIVGNYHAESIDTDVEISTFGSALELRSRTRTGCARFMLQPLARLVWAAKQDHPLGLTAVLSFQEGCATFWFASYNSRNIAFQRVGA
jgi:CubicO group peptidase (beta-lactamase class C family)